MTWLACYSPLTLTTSNPTAQSPPDGLAAYAVTRSGSTYGKSWVVTGTSKSVDLTASASGTPGYVLIAGANYSSSATINFYKGSQGGSRTLLCALEKVQGVNLWFGIPNTAVVSTTAFSIDIADAAATTLETPYIEAGSATTLTGLGRPNRNYNLIDLSTKTQGQTGAAFSSEQPTQLVLSFDVQAQDSSASGSLDYLRGLFAAQKTVRPILMCLESSNPTRFGNTIYGLLQAIPTQPIAAGMMTQFTMTIAEMVA